MRTIALALAASTMIAAAPVIAKSPFTSPPGKDPKVCLLAFSTAAEADAGADADVIKAQYVPLQIALKIAKDPSVSAIGWYGPDELTDAEVDLVAEKGFRLYNHPGGIGTREQCELYMDIAADNAGEDDDDDI